MKESCTSIKKHSDSTSKTYTIKDVEINAKEVKIYIGKEVFPLSIDSYLSDYFYPGKVLEEEGYQKLQIAVKQSKARTYLLYLLSHGRYTEKELQDKIQNKCKIEKKEIDLILSSYKKEGIIDDKQYTLDYIENKVEQGYGKNYLLAELKKKGIQEEILKDSSVIKALSFGESKIPSLIEKEEKKRSSLPIRKKKEYIQSFLMRRGYPTSTIQEEIDKYFSQHIETEKEKENKMQLFKNEARKCYNSVLKKKIDPIKRKQSFLQHLLRKGYEYQEIENLIETEGYTFHD